MRSLEGILKWPHPPLEIVILEKDIYKFHTEPKEFFKDKDLIVRGKVKLRVHVILK